MILGIDPGAEGAFVLLRRDGTMAGCWDMPLGEERVGGKVRPRVDAAGVAEYLRFMARDARRVVIEKVGPSISPRGSFTLGRASGIVEAAAHAFIGHVDFVAPQKWKANFGLGADKDAAVRRAQAFWPTPADMFIGPRGGLLDGRAEAALIARYFLSTL